MTDRITHEELTELFEYSYDDGFFRYKKRVANRAVGSVAGTINRKNYRTIYIKKKAYSAARLAFFYHHKKWPSVEIDHVNRVRDDNRICNLVEATRRENCQNKLQSIQKDLPHGVEQVKRKKTADRYTATICHNKKRYYLGTFDTVEEASQAYQDAAKRMKE